MKTCLEVAQAAKLSLTQESHGWWVGRCPRHDDAVPSLRIAPDGSHWKCYPCNKGGDAIELARWLTGCGFHEALDLVQWNGGVMSLASAFSETRPQDPAPRLLADVLRMGLLPMKMVDQALDAEDVGATLCAELAEISA